MSALADLADRINTAHDARLEAERSGFYHALHAGEWLIEAKRQVEHGDWGAWVRENCPRVGMRVAQEYMLVARAVADGRLIAQRVAYLSFRGVLQVLRQPREGPPYWRGIRPRRLQVTLEFANPTDRDRYWDLLHDLRSVSNPVPAVLAGLQLLAERRNGEAHCVADQKAVAA